MSSAVRISPLVALFLSVAVSAQDAESIPLLGAGMTMRPFPWQPVDDEPAWYAAPPREPGSLLFACRRRGSRSDIAQVRAVQSAETDARRTLRDHLAPSLGLSQTDAVVAVLCKHTALADAALIGTKRIPGARGPGQTVGSAYLLWRVAVRPAVRELAPEIQGRVERALLRPVVHWQEVGKAPAWAAALPARDEWFRFVTTCEEDKPRTSRLNSLTRGREDCERLLLARLRPIVGAAQAERCVEAALQRLAAVERADWTFRADPTPERKFRRVWATAVLYEVPISAIVRHVPAKLRERAESALR